LFVYFYGAGLIQLAIQDIATLSLASASQSHAAKAIEAVHEWLEKAVIGLNLCPFAKSVNVKKQIRYAVTDAKTDDDLLNDLLPEIHALQAADPAVCDTTLLIHPYVLNNFEDYNDFLGIVDAVIEQLGISGEIQVASFHPDYQFADTEADDVSNYTNRSPYPILHLLRESSIERAVAAFPDASEIYQKNMDTLRQLDPEMLQALGFSLRR
jgi:hypothetical protein